MTLKDTILYGDCRETLNNLTNLSVQMCVTSPPYYGLRDYGGEKSQIGQEQTPEDFIDELVKVFRIVRDKLKDDGTLWVNIGDSYYNYRPSKGKSYPKQTLRLSKIYLTTVAREIINYQTTRRKILSVSLGCLLSHYAMTVGIYVRI